MNSKRFFALLMAALALVVVAAEKSSDSGVLHVNHEQVAAAFARGGPLLATNNFKVLALRRDAPGEVEIHDWDTDIFYIIEGSAKFVTGGKAIEPRPTGAGEVRAKSVVGGEERLLMKGDVLVIPNGVPHWFKEVSAPFLYYVVKVSK